MTASAKRAVKITAVGAFCVSICVVIFVGFGGQALFYKMEPECAAEARLSPDEIDSAIADLKVMKHERGGVLGKYEIEGFTSSPQYGRYRFINVGYCGLSECVYLMNPFGKYNLDLSIYPSIFKTDHKELYKYIQNRGLFKNFDLHDC